MNLPLSCHYHFVGLRHETHFRNGKIPKFDSQYFIDFIDLAIPATDNAFKKECTNQNLTTCAKSKEAVLERLEDDDQAQEEICKTEDHDSEDSRRYRRATSGGYGNLFT